jgi:hypothetical protein
MIKPYRQSNVNVKRMRESIAVMHSALEAAISCLRTRVPYQRGRAITERRL